MPNVHHWLVVAFESDSRDPRPQLETEYDGLKIHIQPHMDEYCDVMSTFVRPAEDHQQVRLRLNRFLSAMAWKDGNAFITRGSIAGGARANEADKPRFNYGEKRHLPGGVISQFDFEHLVVPVNDRQRLGLALFREGLNSDNEFYRFLSFYKIVNILHSDPKDQMRWIEANLGNLRFDAAERAQQLQAKTAEVGKYLYVQGRTAIAHAFGKPIRDPDLPGDRIEIRTDGKLMRGLAALLIESELGVPSLSTIMRQHLYELAGFKELLVEDLSRRLGRGETVPVGEIPSMPRLTIGLKERQPYDCLNRLDFRVARCEQGIVTLQTDSEAEPMRVSIKLNFPAETIELDLKDFGYDQDHWRYRKETGDSYYAFLRDYYGNGSLQVFDAVNGDRLSHKEAFIPVNIDFGRTFLNFDIKRAVINSRG